MSSTGFGEWPRWEKRYFQGPSVVGPLYQGHQSYTVAPDGNTCSSVLGLTGAKMRHVQLTPSESEGTEGAGRLPDVPAHGVRAPGAPGPGQNRQGRSDCTVGHRSNNSNRRHCRSDDAIQSSSSKVVGQSSTRCIVLRYVCIAKRKNMPKEFVGYS